MRAHSFIVSACAALAFGAVSASAQDNTVNAAAPQGRPVIAAGTVVQISIVNLISSKVAQPRDMFPIELAEPIKVGDQILVPAGVTGEGEVVDAGDGGFGGAPAKLVLAVRYINVNGERMPLRGASFAEGKSTATSVAVVSAIPVVGLASLFMKGGNIDVPAGTRASAKVSADFVIPPLSATVVNEAESPAIAPASSEQPKLDAIPASADGESP
jgi:hypothetical protein